jgi:ribonuclease HI
MNGFFNKFEETKLLIEKWNPTALCLQETRLKHKDKPKIKDYTGYYNSNNTAIHGTAILVKNNVHSEEFFIFTDLDAVAVKIHMEKIVTVLSIYIPPSNVSTTADRHEVKQHLKELVDQLETPFIITGDFNAHNRRWGCDNENSFGQDVEDWIDECSLLLLNTGEKTHLSLAHGTESAIDLSLCSIDISGDLLWFVDDDQHGSDHSPLIIQTVTESSADTKRPRFKMHTANWQKYKDKTKIISQIENITVKNFTEIIMQSAEQSIQKTKPNSSNKKLKWKTPEIQELIRARRRAERKLKKPHTIAEIIEYKRLKALVRLKIKKTRRNSWIEFAESINERTPTAIIWKKIGSIDGKRRSLNIKQLRNEDGTVITNKKDIANMMADTFAANSSNSNYDGTFLNIKQNIEQTALNININNAADYNVDFIEEEMMSALDDCSGTSPGPDGVEYDLIKQLDRPIKLILLRIYNNIWNTGDFPDSWRQAIVVPVLKPGKNPDLRSSYRPIALTSCICKLMERMVNRRLVWYLETNNLLTNYQYGFRSGRSTIDALAILEEKACESIRQRKPLTICSLDLKGAYDTCWVRGALDNMVKMQINGKMLQYAKNFSTDRKIRVSIGNTYSRRTTIENGVPQGAVISVTLFLIAINPIVTSVSPGSLLVGYADDWAILASSRNIRGANAAVQNTLDKISDWTAKNGFKISADKTKVITITKRKFDDEHHTNIFLNGNVIERVSQHTILGLVIDERLNWSSHLKKVKDKANSKLNILKCLAGKKWGADASILLKIHKAVVLPTLRYGEEIYGSAKESDLQKLEPVNNKGIKIAFGAFCVSKNDRMRKEAGIITVSEMRKIKTLNFAIKIASQKQHILEPETRRVIELHTRIHDPKSLISRARALAKELVLDLSKIKKVQGKKIPPWSSGIEQYIDTSMLEVSKAADVIKRAHFMETLEKFGDHQAIFTDGSKTDNSTGFAAITDDEVIIQKRISSIFSIYTAEIRALIHSIEAKKHHPQKIVLYTDSLSSVLATLNRKTKNADAIQLANLIYEREGRVIITWIPSHCGIPGNEKADQLAKETSNSIVDLFEPISINDASHLVKTTYNCRNFNNNNNININENNNNNHNNKIIQNHKNQSQLNRKQQVAVFRTKIGYTRLTHKYIIEKTVIPNCDSCNVNLTIEHILTQCNKYNSERASTEVDKVWRALRSNDTLDPQNDVNDKILEFLETTGLIDEV